MNALADHIATNNLTNNQEKMTAYNNLANVLYRTKDNNKSALCYSFYMEKRRTFINNEWYSKVLNRNQGETDNLNSIVAVNANAQITTDATAAKQSIVTMQNAASATDAFDQGPQRKATRDFVKAMFQVVGSLLSD